MRRNYARAAGVVATAALIAGCGSQGGGDPAAVRELLDRQAIESTLVRYSFGLDTFDADLYASVFTEDAEFAMEGRTYRGRDEIRTIITGMKAGRDERAADADPSNDPPPKMHHVLTNSEIEITGTDTARHRGYWMTVNGGPEMYAFRVAAIGGYEDELVRRDGRWLIHRRSIVQ